MNNLSKLKDCPSINLVIFIFKFVSKIVYDIRFYNNCMHSIFHLNFSTNTLTLSWLPFFKAYCTRALAIYFVLAIVLTISTACWSWQTSHSPSLAIIKNWELLSTGNVYISGIFETPYIFINFTSVLSPRSPNALVIANWPATLPFKIKPPSFLILSC